VEVISEKAGIYREVTTGRRIVDPDIPTMPVEEQEKALYVEAVEARKLGPMPPPALRAPTLEEQETYKKRREEELYGVPPEKEFVKGFTAPGEFAGTFQRDQPWQERFEERPYYYAGALTGEVTLAVGAYGAAKYLTGLRAPAKVKAPSTLRVRAPAAEKQPMKPILISEADWYRKFAVETGPIRQPKLTITRLRTPSKDVPRPIPKIKPPTPPPEQAPAIGRQPMKPIRISEADWYRKFTVETGPARHPKLVTTRTRLPPEYIRDVQRQMRDVEVYPVKPSPVKPPTPRQVEAYLKQTDKALARKRVTVGPEGKVTFREPTVPKGYRAVRSRTGQVTLQKVEVVTKVRAPELVRVKPTARLRAPPIVQQQQKQMQKEGQIQKQLRKQQEIQASKLVSPELARPLQLGRTPKQLQVQAQKVSLKVAVKPKQRVTPVTRYKPYQYEEMVVPPLQKVKPRLITPPVSGYIPVRRQIVPPRQITPPIQRYAPVERGVVVREQYVPPILKQVVVPQLQVTPQTRPVLHPYIPKRKRLKEKEPKGWARWRYSIFRNIPRRPR